MNVPVTYVHVPYDREMLECTNPVVTSLRSLCLSNVVVSHGNVYGDGTDLTSKVDISHTLGDRLSFPKKVTTNRI